MLRVSKSGGKPGTAEENQDSSSPNTSLTHFSEDECGTLHWIPNQWKRESEEMSGDIKENAKYYKACHMCITVPNITHYLQKSQLEVYANKATFF